LAYSGWLLPQSERAKLLGLIPAVYPDVYAHHVTLELGAYDKLATPDWVTAEIIGFADNNDGVQALVIRINGSTERPMGGTFHITWSLDTSKGYKPVDSNRVIEDGWTPLVLVTPIEVEPRVFR
jgi:hypothetical protein